MKLKAAAGNKNIFIFFSHKKSFMEKMLTVNGHVRGCFICTKYFTKNINNETDNCIGTRCMDGRICMV